MTSQHDPIRSNSTWNPEMAAAWADPATDPPSRNGSASPNGSGPHVNATGRPPNTTTPIPALRLSLAMPPMPPATPMGTYAPGSHLSEVYSRCFPEAPLPGGSGHPPATDWVRGMLLCLGVEYHRGDELYAWPEACSCGGDVLIHDTGNVECTSCHGDVAALLQAELDEKGEEEDPGGATSREREAPAGARGEQTSREGRRGRRVMATPGFDTFTPRALRYIEGEGMAQRFPIGKLSIIAGAGGQGKSTLTCKITAQQSQHRTVMIVSAEDDPGDTIRPRLAAEGAVMPNVKAYRLVEAHGAEAEEGEAFVMPDDCHLMREAIIRENIEVVIIDPLMSHLDEKVKSNSDQDIRRALKPLERMGRALGVTFIVICHFKKDLDTAIINMIGGSVGIGNYARSVHAFVHNPEDPEGEDGPERLLVHVKANSSQLCKPAVFRMVGATGEGMETNRLVYLGESDLSKTQAVGGEERRGGNHAAPTPADLARSGIVAQLRGGPARGKDMETVASAFGIGLNVHQVARAMLAKDGKIEAYQEGRKHLWRLAAGGGQMAVARERS